MTPTIATKGCGIIDLSNFRCFCFVNCRVMLSSLLLLRRFLILCLRLLFLLPPPLFHLLAFFLCLLPPPLLLIPPDDEFVSTIQFHCPPPSPSATSTSCTTPSSSPIGSVPTPHLKYSIHMSDLPWTRGGIAVVASWPVWGGPRRSTRTWRNPPPGFAWYVCTRWTWHRKCRSANNHGYGAVSPLCREDIDDLAVGIVLTVIIAVATIAVVPITASMLVAGKGRPKLLLLFWWCHRQSRCWADDAAILSYMWWLSALFIRDLSLSTKIIWV